MLWNMFRQVSVSFKPAWVGLLSYECYVKVFHLYSICQRENCLEVYLIYLAILNVFKNIGMENPLCFSNYFINKQTVRSIQNVFNYKLLNDKNQGEFFLSVLGDKFLVSELSKEFLDILLILRSNVKNNCKQDFKDFFHKNHDYHLSSKLMPVPKGDIIIGCWKAVYETVPKKLIGNQQNMKIFKDLIRVVLFSMKNQHIFLHEFTRKWDVTVYPWDMLSDATVNQILNATLCWILKNILPAIICLNFFVTTCKIDTNENKLHFFWKNEWQSFFDKKILEMINSKVLDRHEASYTGNKGKYDSQERLCLKTANRKIPKLHLVLKPNNNCRPIVRYKNAVLTSCDKSKFRDRLKFLRVLTGKPQDKIESQYSSFYSSWIAHKQPKLYFVKADLCNAFGSINRMKLMKILAERHLSFQKSEQPLFVKKKFAQNYRELMSELRKPMLIRAGAKVYEWKDGLIQGYRYSPALSELYYTYLDELYLSHHWKKYESQLRIFIRVVDDYLYATNSIEDAHSFINAISSYGNVNYEKTVVNFIHPTIKLSDEITFLGYTYNTETLQVNRANYLYTEPICYKLSFSNAISDKGKFIENRIGQSGVQVNSHLFNFIYNNEELIWKHIFLTFCLSANKFCTILAIICNEKEMQSYFELYKKQVSVKLCNAIIDVLLKNKPSDFLFVYCINHFRYLSFKALSLCSNKTQKCNVLVPLVKKELAKTNCIFGKFREHGSRIDRHGNIVRPASKEVCRRTDLRVIMKQFEILPKGFECYSYKKNFNY